MTTQKRIDQFANRIAARLEGGGVPHDVSERLRIARQQALAARKTAALAAAQPASAIVTQGRHAALAAGAVKAGLAAERKQRHPRAGAGRAHHGLAVVRPGGQHH